MITKEKQRYKVSFEEGGTNWCSYTNDINEAQEYAKEKLVVTNHHVVIIDTKNDVVVNKIS